MANVWNSSIHTAEQALDLPLGRYAADFGFLVEQSASPDKVLECALALKESGKEVLAASQAGVLVKAQSEGVALQDWATLSLI